MPSGPAPSTIEKLQAAHALGKSWRYTLAGLLGAPAAAALWAYTSGMLAAFEAGGYDPRRFGGSDGWELIGLAWRYLAIGLYAVAGKAGIHLLMGGLVTATLALVAWSTARRRALIRRYGVEALLSPVRELPARSRPAVVRSSLSPWAVLRIGMIWGPPLASAALTAAFVWAALTR